MKYYSNYLKENNYKVKYINFNKTNNYKFLDKYDSINFFDLNDHLLEKRLTEYIKKNKKDYVIHDSPLFLLTLEDIMEYKIKKGKSNNYFHKNFYDWQLKKLDIPFITKSYDTLNRKSIPKNLKIPKYLK